VKRSEENDRGEVRYGRDVRRILSDRCFQCHGSDAAARESDLRLDVREGAVEDRGGYAVILPGNAQESELWLRITSDDPDEVMPPPRAKKRPLTAEDMDMLARWIDAGAEYEAHWAFVAPTLPTVPANADAAWARNEIDRFVLAGLESKGVAPAPEADSATLLRRVFLDLTGLPPTVEELDSFLAEEGSETTGAPGAYERVVDRIFAEELYRSRLAERLTTPWLDASRYADTNGIHMDNGRQMFLWRNLVLASFRDNVPYDRFITEQLAGDLLPDATLDQMVASGFNRSHVITDEGGAIADEYLVEYAVDRVNTTSAVFLGLTAGCARCHDHKFDPLDQEDYYSLFAFFNSNDEPGLYSQTADSNRAYEPFIEVPTDEQEALLSSMASQMESLERQLAEKLPGEDERRAEWLSELLVQAGVDWSVPRVIGAESSDAQVSLVPQDDGSILPTGPMPASEDYVIELRSPASDLRLILLEALCTEGDGDGEDEDVPRVGRASHGNVVITSITVEARGRDTSADWSDVPLTWAWADHSQKNLDYEVMNVLDAGVALGWAADGHQVEGGRNILLLSQEAFGFEGGTDLRIKIAFRSQYERHSLARLRLRVSPLADTSRLPVGLGRWYSAGPFLPVPANDRAAVYETAFGPETLETIDLEHPFGTDNKKWVFGEGFGDERVVALPSGISASYVGRTIWSPDIRDLEVSLGTDDGYLLFHDGNKIGENRVDRGAAPDQERVTIPLKPGPNAVVFKIVNTGGIAGYYFRELPPEEMLVGELPSALLPEDAIPAQQVEELALAWRRHLFEDYRQLDDERAAIEEERKETLMAVPRAMVMRELEEPRETFVLKRGQYDHPDKTRPVERRMPAFLPPLPTGAPRNRLGLAQWLFTPENPLFARVAVNSFWQTIFGAGLVRTPEDFGQQGEWPTHPELLDWLAVHFRESGWDVHALLRLFVTSSTYRQSSVVRSDIADSDPENRWLASSARRRLSAEQIRDHALYTSGLLVERFGGPSVKPYQPAGLWKEVAMGGSNTREFKRGDGEDLWRRSLYTYWKRAVPPPSLQTFDAPTRESCVIQRQSTNTPLQALVLWNDVQYVEAARAFALRALEARDEDEQRLVWMFRSSTARVPEAEELELLAENLDAFRQRFAEAPEDADELLAFGEAMVPEDVDRVDLAAWAMIANAVFNLHETLTQD
jgi:hypothetical protein